MAEIRSLQAMLASSQSFRDISLPTDQEVKAFLESELGETVRSLLERLNCRDVDEGTRWILIAAEWGARDDRHLLFSAQERANFAEAIEEAAKRLRQLLEFEHENECVGLFSYIAGSLPEPSDIEEPETEQDWANEETKWQELRKQSELAFEILRRCPGDLDRIIEGAQKAARDWQSNRKFERPKRPSYRTIADVLVGRVLMDHCDPDSTYSRNRSLASLFRIVCDLGGISYPTRVTHHLKNSIERWTE